MSHRATRVTVAVEAPVFLAIAAGIPEKAIIEMVQYVCNRLAKQLGKKTNGKAGRLDNAKD